MRQRADSTSSIATTDNEEETPNTYKIRKSRLNRLINWSHVLSVYTPQLVLLTVSVIVYQLGMILDHSIYDMTLREIVTLVKTQVLQYSYTHSFVLSVSLFVIVASVLIHTMIHRPCYLMSFSTFKAPDSWKLTQDEIMTCMENQGVFTEESLSFMKRMLSRSGTGNSTAWPPGISQSLDPSQKMDASIESSRKEAKIVIFEVVADALKKANVSAKEIDFLVINCSLNFYL